eukprot:3219356-Rhodomonas_salina.2
MRVLGVLESRGRGMRRSKSRVDSVLKAELREALRCTDANNAKDEIEHCIAASNLLRRSTHCDITSARRDPRSKNSQAAATGKFVPQAWARGLKLRLWYHGTASRSYGDRRRTIVRSILGHEDPCAFWYFFEERYFKFWYG